MFNPSPRQFKVIKALLFVIALLPFARLIAFTALDRLGANPVEFITRNTGDWTLYFLCITLSVTPLRRFSNWNWLLKLRRMTGLYAFFYATLHFTTFLWFDHFFDVNEASLHHGWIYCFRVIDSVGIDQYQRHDQTAGRQALAVATSADLRRRAARDFAFLVDEGSEAQF